MVLFSASLRMLSATAMSADEDDDSLRITVSKACDPSIQKTGSLETKLTNRASSPTIELSHPIRLPAAYLLSIM